MTLLLEDDIDISRGDMIVKAGALPRALNVVDAELCWLATAPLDPRRTCLIRHTTREVRAKLVGIEYRLDIATLCRVTADSLAMNDIARVSFRLARSVFCDPYAENRATGAFIVIDEATNDTVGAGMIV